MVLYDLNRADGFTASERLVARYVLTHGDTVSGLSADALARAALTSKATVLRLCRKIGCSSYGQFKQVFQDEWGELARVRRLLATEPFNAKSTYHDVVETLPTIYEKVIVRTRQTMRQDAVERSVRILRAAERIEIYGTGLSYALAQTAAFKLSAAGLDAAALDGVNEHYTAIAFGSVSRAAILLSFTGGNSNMVHAACYLREHGVSVIGVGGEARGDLADACDVYLPFRSDGLLLSMEALETQLSMSYVLDVLYTLLVVDDYQRVLDASVAALIGGGFSQLTTDAH